MKNELVIKALSKCQAVSDTPEVSCAVAVGLAVAMARPLVSDKPTIDAVVGYTQAFKVISACNELCILCTDTATQTYSTAYQARVDVAEGNTAGLRKLAGVDLSVLDAVDQLVPIFKEIFQN